MSLSIDKSIALYLDEIVALRHELHQHPEIRYEEKWTARRIATFLESLDIDFSSGHAGGTGIVGLIQGGKGPGKTVALRADMDALELQEQSTLPYASTIPGRMHACGHDGHMACLCGAAKLLAAHRQNFAGTVKLIFQPAEEQGGGGRLVVQEGLLDDVDAVFALHGWPEFPLGTIATGRDLMMASADFFKIEILGQGGHGADPGATIDPVLVAAHTITALQALVARECNPWEAAVVTIARLQAGSTSNIIPDTALLEGTFRALTPERRTALAQGIDRIATHTAQAFRAQAQVSLPMQEGYPPLRNTPAMSQLLEETARAVFGPDAVIPLPQPYMVAEDFACYLEKKPGAFVFLGLAESSESPALHTASFDFNDAAIPMGMGLLSSIALRYLAQ